MVVDLTSVLKTFTIDTVSIYHCTATVLAIEASVSIAESDSILGRYDLLCIDIQDMPSIY